MTDEREILFISLSNVHEDNGLFWRSAVSAVVFRPCTVPSSSPGLSGAFYCLIHMINN